MKILKQSSLLFWGVWFFIVLTTNTTDLLKAFHFLPDTWAFASGNWIRIESFIKNYGMSNHVTLLLFLIILLWEIVIICAFLRAFFAYSTNASQIFKVNQAFYISLSFWVFFLLGDEFFILYDMEGKHIILAILMLLNFFAFYCLPNEILSE